ncbi:MAG: hypothetical protein AB7R89_13710 [Dehalococcoidia bacterium]
MPDMPSMDHLVLRCETMGWGYEVGCWVDHAELINSGATVVVDSLCRAEVTDPHGTTVTIEDAKTGHDALARAVGSMESLVKGRVTAGREG